MTFCSAAVWSYDGTECLQLCLVLVAVTKSPQLCDQNSRAWQPALNSDCRLHLNSYLLVSSPYLPFWLFCTLTLLPWPLPCSPTALHSAIPSPFTASSWLLPSASQCWQGLPSLAIHKFLPKPCKPSRDCTMKGGPAHERWAPLQQQEEEDGKSHLEMPIG